MLSKAIDQRHHFRWRGECIEWGFVFAEDILCADVEMLSDGHWGGKPAAIPYSRGELFQLGIGESTLSGLEGRGVAPNLRLVLGLSYIA